MTLTRPQCQLVIRPSSANLAHARYTKQQWACGDWGDAIIVSQMSTRIHSYGLWSFGSAPFERCFKICLVTWNTICLWTRGQNVEGNVWRISDTCGHGPSDFGLIKSPKVSSFPRCCDALLWLITAQWMYAVIDQSSSPELNQTSTRPWGDSVCGLCSGMLWNFSNTTEVGIR